MPLFKFLLISLLLVSCGSIARQDRKAVSNADFCILSDKYSQDCVRSLYVTATEIGMLDRIEARSVLDQLPAITSKAQQSGLVNKGKDLDEVNAGLGSGAYVFQLIGFKLNGERYVFFNALSKRREIPGWRKSYKMISDGGSNYWFGVYSLDRKIPILFLINGHG